jgi:hypothetical protein
VNPVSDTSENANDPENDGATSPDAEADADGSTTVTIPAEPPTST